MKTLLTYLLGAALVGSVLTNCATHNRLQAERLAHQTTKAQHAQLMAAAEKQRADEEAKRRKAEQELIDETEQHKQEMLAVRNQLVAVRSDGRRVAERLRNAASEAASHAQRASEVCSDPAFAELRQATQDTIKVLAELRERADERAGILAQFATDAHLAGLACERRYDEARAKVVAY